MKKNFIIIIAALMLITAIFSSCSGDSDEAIGVSSLKIDSITKTTVSNTSSTAPVSYDVKVSWNTADIMADGTAASAISGLTVSYSFGTEELEPVDLELSETSYTFKNLLPGDSASLKVTAKYADGVYSESSAAESVRFVGGPWYNGVTTALPEVERFSVGSFNNINSMPVGTFQLDDVYYYNPYNTEYQFESTGDVRWFLVAVNEVTATNDTTEQRNNVQWLVNNFRLCDDQITTDDTDIASVDAEIYDIYGNSLYSITGSATGGAMSTTNFNNLLSSVDSGYYADKTGYFFVKATCKTMPSLFSSGNTEELGRWGFGIVGARR